jgi:hypothetical protein
MGFRSTLALLVVFGLLGGYVYFTEFRGIDERQQREASEKKLVSFDPKSISELSITYADNQIDAVRKAEREWQITNPPGIDADDEAWETLAQSLSDIQRDDAIPSTAADLPQFGLDKPQLVISV